MRIQTTVLLVLLVGVIGCDDGGPLAPTPVVVDEPGPTSSYVAVHRGRCPSDGDLPFSVRENGWFWPDTCRNNHGEIIQLSDWCSGTRQVVRGACVLNSPSMSSTLSVTGPTQTVPDNACVTYTIGGGTPPYQLATYGGQWMTSRPCRGNTPVLHTLSAPGGAVWSATGLDPGDTARVTVTDADGAREGFTVTVVGPLVTFQ